MEAERTVVTKIEKAIRLVLVATLVGVPLIVLAIAVAVAAPWTMIVGAGLAVLIVHCVKPRILTRARVSVQIWWRTFQLNAVLREFLILTAIAIFLAGFSRHLKTMLWIVLGLPVSIMLARYWWKQYR